MPGKSGILFCCPLKAINVAFIHDVSLPDLFSGPNDSIPLQAAHMIASPMESPAERIGNICEEK
jgi:hypothetical protein